LSPSRRGRYSPSRRGGRPAPSSRRGRYSLPSRRGLYSPSARGLRSPKGFLARYSPPSPSRRGGLSPSKRLPKPPGLPDLPPGLPFAPANLPPDLPPGFAPNFLDLDWNLPSFCDISFYSFIRCFGQFNLIPESEKEIYWLLT